MYVFRIYNRRHGPLDGAGAATVGGRWNPIGSPVVYAACTFEGALLEQLVHANTGRLPSNQKVAKILIPEDLEVRTLVRGETEDWRRQSVSQRLGAEWLARREAVAVVVPSVVSKPWGQNALLNPLHPAFRRLEVVDTSDVVWDPRLRVGV